MESFARTITAGETIIEIGGHIGYLSVFFARLAGPDGHVFVFEPGENNLPYLHKNVAQKKNIRVIDKAASDQDGDITFYVENLSGQNNTMRQDFPGLEANRALAFVPVSYVSRKVSATTIDTFVANAGVRPTFIKIDVEGGELCVLRGALWTLQTFAPRLMVEVNMDFAEVASLLTQSGYQIFDDSLRELQFDIREPGNYFCFPRASVK